MNYRSARMTDLDAIMEIENIGFSPEEAATTAAMEERIKLIPDTFIVAEAKGKICGYVVGPAIYERYLTDSLFDKTIANPTDAPYQSVLSLAVHPQYRASGIAGQLLAELAKTAKMQGRQAITLTCLAELVTFYETHGYKNEGVSASQHADEVWFNMVLAL